MPDFPVAALRSVELTTPHLAVSAEFYTKVWGLDVAAAANGTVYLAATGRDFHVLELTPGEATSLRKVSFRVRSHEDLHRLFVRARQAGCEVINPPAPSPAPPGGESFVVREPQGCAMEFVHGDRTKAARVIAERPERLAHVNINSADVEKLSAFYQETLGFRLSDRSKLMAFLCCNSDHHAIVLAEAPRNGLNHVAFLMPDLESVMRGSGRMVDHGHPIGWGVGRHGPGDNVFAYFVDPAGTVIEYTAEVLQIDDSYVAKGPADWVWPPGRTDQWGIAPPKSDACKAAQLAIPFATAST
ncbi:VOC family protein [Bradyrhizobium diazoefficiens]|jgi:catechol-2,3-dioxygenase|nr:VOC family protein [Bradyrhizobium diazoefficiens]UCF51773.1 MAG: VOC family protein [Bradyrhizobium sp.]MBR0967558.1 VOC family protein [Bradyrhizobium diazoefficiens]MBR0980952.1 VOC family protein [Bradyrhizobium diazoefficiens]MBR1010429.1 VOC family protein [Bradyrhizobium diazoefficiens]MBR1017085.1 VOC family protein [Bradyrhizobium diazoefficiens]